MRTTTFIIAAGFALAGSLAAQLKLDSARNALAESLPEVAVARAERYLAANPDLPEKEKTGARLLLAEAYLRTQQAGQALATLEKVPNTSASARDYWQGMALAHQLKYQQAFEKLSNVEESHPLYSQALFNALELQASQKQTATAFELLKKLRAHNAEFLPDQLIFLEAQLHLINGEPDTAREALEALTDKQKQSAKSQLLTGQIELAANQPQAAREAFEKALTPTTSAQIRTLALLGKSDALLKSLSFQEALNSLLTLLKEEESQSHLNLLPNRLELIVNQAPSKEGLVTSLSAYVQPETLGEDGNLLSPQKLLACYYLSRISDPEQAKELLQLATTLSPEGELAARAHIELAKLALENKETEAALQSLEKAQTSAPKSSYSMAAADLSARIKTQEGDLESALTLFSQAAKHPDSTFSEQALLNQALLTLATTPTASLSALATQLESEDAKISLKLERALASAREQSASAREDLQEFLFHHPDHSRMAQARLSLAEILLIEQQPDFPLIDQQLASLPEELVRKLSRKKFRISHDLAVITNDWNQSVSNGERHLKDFPEAKNDPYFLLRLGESNFRNGNHNRSRFLFSKTAALPDAGELLELALYFNAISNLTIPTEESTTEALDTLDELIERAGPLASRARLRKARTLIDDLGRAQECLQTLDGIPGGPGDQPEAALLAARAHRELSASEPKHAEKALSIYRRLLDDPRTSYPLSNEIHYQLSRTYSQIGQPNLAIDPCLSVVDLENRSPNEVEVEWEYYYRCGFEAIDILLEAKKARAALILAQKLAQTKGPSAEEAGKRAKQIQLDHQLFTD